MKMNSISECTPSCKQVSCQKRSFVRVSPADRNSIRWTRSHGVGLLLFSFRGILCIVQERADHIGFEIKNLEAFCKKLEASGVKFDRPYGKSQTIPGLGLAFLTDPWGTYIEINEGLDKL